MHNKMRTIAWLLFLIVMVPGLAFAAHRGRLIGRIVDPQGNPIPGVTVTTTSPQLPNFRDVQTTDKKGVFTIDFDQINVVYQYRFDKTGYDSVEANQTWTLEGSQLFSWTLKPAKVVVAATSGTAPASTSAPAVEAFNAGLAAFKAKDYPTAETKFNEAVTHDPNLRQAWTALSALELEMGKNKEAAAAAEKAIAMGSTEEAVYLSRWQAYKNLNDPVKTAEALKDLEKVGRRSEEAKKIHNEAVALAKAGDNAGAYAKFQEALTVDPNLEVSLIGLSTAALKIGKNAEAITAAETILKADPKNEAAARVRYNAALALGDKAKLIDALIGLNPYEPKIARDGLLRLAFEAYDANDLVVAKDRFEKVVKLDPTYAQAYYYLGVINAGRGASAEAKSQIEKFLQLAPNDPEAKSAREMLKYIK